MYLIKEMPKKERPREKLINKGASSLTNIELLAILLRTGNKRKSVLELSKDVLYKLEELNDLKEITYKELVKIPGIKLAKASTILAAIELGKRLERVEYSNKVIDSSITVYNMFKHLKHEKQETFYCIYLNTRLAVIKNELIYKGTVDQIIIHPREIFKNAIKNSASYIILVHNHPTGNSSPSNADKKTTMMLKETAEVVGIEILDHIIIGNDEFYSFEEGRVNKM